MDQDTIHFLLGVIVAGLFTVAVFLGMSVSGCTAPLKPYPPEDLLAPAPHRTMPQHYRNEALACDQVPCMAPWGNPTTTMNGYLFRKGVVGGSGSGYGADLEDAIYYESGNTVR